MSRSRSRPDAAGLVLRVAAYDDPESVRFVEAVQAFYVERYGGADRTPVDPAEFAPPRGLFLVGSLPGTGAVCCGGWRRHTAATIDVADAAVMRPGDAEIKRMWVDPAHRRRGLAGAVLDELERTAGAAGCGRTILETGVRQPEAQAFYEIRGYERIPNFGVYRDEPDSICFARILV
ncbi:GNAT family N-acetyltransferase [Actinomycetospora endophytica]|uniref:GNAT family N-acetyltransferase n=1 Tax=Actinomycetospora endophytica TaxID=2291215 RepID=A0ABS8PFN7_9PSEU|nr:GNAT family N-acetyltransferase [Actinomycetospora endophytica]MCD2197087.1 GNAT family N-acetyltransferase [Actinomycetospora endophytica]